MIDGLITAIVRPPRAQYKPSDLGSSRLKYKGIEFIREDFEIRNHQQHTLRGSLWKIADATISDNKSCILYLHPNSGSRVDVVRTKIMSVAAQAKCAVCGFDFAGCGLSEGEHISLGVREKEDVCSIIASLLSRGIRRIILWGRSMGAATSVMLQGAYHPLLQDTIVGMILDSPFTSFNGLAHEYSHSHIPLGSLVLPPALAYLRSSILAKHQFDITYMNPAAAGRSATIPTIVLSGSSDKIVSPKLSKELYDIFPGPKMHVLFNGGHNSQRPAVIIDVIRVFIAGIFRDMDVADVFECVETLLQQEMKEHPKTSEPPVAHPIPMMHTSPRKHKSSPKSTRPVSEEDAELAEAQKLADEAESVIRSMLAAKPADAITPEDVASALGQHPPVTPVVVSEELPPTRDLKPRTNSGKRLSELKASHKTAPITPVHQPHTMRPHHIQYILAIEKDLGNTQNVSEKRSSSSESYSWWSYTPMSLFYPASAPVHAEGTFEHIIHHSPSSMSPPLLQAWEGLLVEKAIELSLDDLLDQILELVVGMVAVAITQPKSDNKILLKDVPHDQRSLMMSVIIAQLVSDAGIGSLESGESLSWSYLLAACIDMSDERDDSVVIREAKLDIISDFSQCKLTEDDILGSVSADETY